jgi:hypothetical protein
VYKTAATKYSCSINLLTAAPTIGGASVETDGFYRYCFLWQRVISVDKFLNCTAQESLILNTAGLYRRTVRVTAPTHCSLVSPCVPYRSTLKTDAVQSAEGTEDVYQTTWRFRKLYPASAVNLSGAILHYNKYNLPRDTNCVPLATPTGQ